MITTPVRTEYLHDKAKLDKQLDPNKAFFGLYMGEIKKNVSMSKSDFSIVPFLKENGIEPESIMSDVEIPIHTQGYKSHKNSQLKLAIKQNGRLYFPGSSIKGAIKTAFFYNYLLANQDILRNWNLIIENYQNKRQYIEKWASEIEADFNQFFKNKKSEYNLFRVEDSPSFENESLGIWETVRFHLYNSNDETITWLTEAVCSNTEYVEFPITFLPDFNVDYLQVSQ